MARPHIEKAPVGVQIDQEIDIAVHRQRFLLLYSGPYSAINSRDNVETIVLP